MKILSLIIKNKYCIILSVSSLVLGMVFGELIYTNTKVEISSNNGMALVKEYNVEKKFSNFNNFVSILSNNIKSSFILILGCLSFGITTFYGLYINGMVCSMFISSISVKSFLIYVLPHSVFEIPAIIIAGAAGFKVPYEIVQYLRDKKEKPLTEEDIKEFLKLTIISITLIIIAAFVEVYVTPKIVDLFGHI